MLAALALLLAGGAQTPRDTRPAVALIPLRALGVSAEVANALQTTLRNELSALPEAHILPEKEIAEALQKEPECEAHVACAVTAAAKAGARQLVAGTVSRLGNALVIDLKLVDARSGLEQRRATRAVTGSQDVLIDALRAAAVELLAPQRFVGSLRVEVPGVSGAMLFLDGRPVGQTPLPQPIEGLSPGQHTVRVADAGMRELSAFVDIQYGQTTDARFDLGMAPVRTVPLPALPAAESSSPRRSWIRPAAYAGLGVGVASAALAIFFQAKAYATASDLNRREAVNGLRATDAGSYAEIDRQVKAARGLYVAAAILGAAGGGLLLWDMNAFGIQGKF